MPCFRLPVFLCLALVIGSVGCSGTQQIETPPPQQVTPAFPPTIETPTQHAPLAVFLETSAMPLPDEVQSLRFRVTAIHLKQQGGAWTTLPAEVNTFEIASTQLQRKLVLSTRVPAGPYEALGLTFSDVFVLFDANAGGPLTMPRDEPVHVTLDLAPLPQQSTVVWLTLEPGASISHGSDGRWFLLPFLTGRVEQAERPR